MASTILEYAAGDITCRGEYFMPSDASGPLPVVLVVHAWDGLNDEVRGKASRLAQEAGYIAFAVDMHGNGKVYEDMADLMPALTPFLEDRGMLTARITAAVEAAKSIPNADTSRLGAMGYCFGGMTVLDLARADAGDIRGVVSFHGGLEANTLDNPKTLSAKVLVLHGEDDPMVPPELVASFKQEMSSKQADWQLHSYGHTVHAFTRPAANDPAFGAVYNEAADRRSWQAMRNFFSELFDAT
ncbi:MAG: dienelactone hydrolase family protein [Halioglobus sp.]